MALGADRGLDLVIGLVQRFLAGECHQAAGRAAPVEHRGRAFENVDPLKEVRVDLHGTVGAAVAHGLEAVEVDVVHRAIVEAAHRHVVVAMGRAVGVGQYPWGVAHGLGDGLRALVVHLLAGDHGDALRGFPQGGTGLGGDLAVGGVVARHAAQGVTQGKPLDVGGRQRQRAARGLGLQHIAAAIRADGGQA